MKTVNTVQKVLWALYKPRANARTSKLIQEYLRKKKIRKTLGYEQLEELYNIAVNSKRSQSLEFHSEDPSKPTPAELRFKDNIEGRLKKTCRQGKLPTLHRQVLIGSYFYDFVMMRRFKRHRPLVAFEINGGSHNSEAKQAKDSTKFESLKKIVKNGLVMDVTNEQVYENRLSTVIELIEASSGLDPRKKIRIWEKIYISSIATTLNSKSKDPVYAALTELGFPFSVLSALSKIIDPSPTATVAVLKPKEKK